MIIMPHAFARALKVRTLAFVYRQEITLSRG
jgi:hypothetical protein